MSFSSDIKLEAASFQMKKPCCRRAFISGVLLGGADVSGEEISLYVEGDALAELCSKMIKEQFGREAVPEKIGRGKLLLAFSSKSAGDFLQACRRMQADFEKLYKCSECVCAFLRGVFVGGGTVSSPEKKNYHLEIKSRSVENLSELGFVFANEGYFLKSSVRLGKQSLYSKDSGAIEEFLFYIGASKQAFDFMNAKISHEIKNDINRRTNCETSNIARSTASAAKHISAIRYLVDRGRLSELGPELEYTAQMRLQHPEMSLLQLGQVMTPAVSKPGLYHRLEKICTVADNLKSKEI
ncbi:MAG: DNA-binding protein WhiA [Clostridia bacterium]|nr:DNA-binding protein WhiA [Clostridia bacterium]